MAEEVYELEGLQKQLESLLSRYSSGELQADSKPFCSDFCKLVEEYASRWQVPLPQLRILEIALRYFARASTFFTTNCDHVLHTLSSLALSVFELLLFFDQKDFHQEPLKHFTVTFQECHLALARHQNVHLLQVERLVRGGGPWAGPALRAILSESSLPQSEVDGCISSELPVFFELRVHYLLSCERVGEAMALAKCCAAHPTAGRHLFFLQVYLTWLFKTSQQDRLHKEVAEFNGKDAVHIICSLECEETDELLLALSTAFLSQQLRRGDMYYLCDLVFIWSKLHSRLNTSKQALLEESHQLMLSATNVNSIFPFIRAILQELGEDGIQFCVELCANALGSCRPCDVITKSLIYKAIAGLLPNDLEVSRACALLVFFLERTVETYKMVYLLYMHPDQEYNVEYSPIRNHVRFETLQVLKKDLCFDPEFWNLIALRTNCLKLLSEKVVSGALEEIMEDKWILSYCTKEPASRSRATVCQKGRKKRHHKEDADSASKRLNVDHTVKKKGSQGSSLEPLRRSFWQLDRLQDIGELRRTTRLSEKNPPKRRIRKPKWLLEDSGTLGENNDFPKIKKHGLKHERHHGSSVVKESETGELKNNANHKPSVNSHFMARENYSKHRRGFSLDSPKPAASPQVVLELSLPDNELMGTFNEDACNRQRGFPQVLLYRPTLKVPAASQPAKTVHRKEVILRARDAAMFAQQLHCYARRQKGKGSAPNIQGSVSTITRSSVQGSPPKDPLGEKPAAEVKGGIASETPDAAEVTETPVLQAQTTKAVETFSGRELSEEPAAEVKVTNASQTSAASDLTEAPMLDKVLHAPTVASAGELCEEPAVEMKVTIASTAANVTPSPGLDKVSKAVKDAVEVSQTPTEDSDQMVATDKISNISNIGAADSTPSQSQDVLKDGKQDLKSLSCQAETGKNPAAPEVLAAVSNSISEVDVTDVSPSKEHVPCKNDGTVVTTSTPTDQDSIHDMSALTLVTEMVTELAPEALARDLENHKAPEDGSSKGSTAGSKSKAPRKLRTTSGCSVAADVQGKEEGTRDVDPETPEDPELPESEESRLEYCCTFCSKDFKGSRVVAHAMFHYRRDECMFCGTMFKDDLLAMMHLSDHIEKLKRSKEAAGNNAQENCVSETKDISTPKTSAKAKTTDASSGRRGRGRPRKSTNCPISVSLPDSHPSGSRELRSGGKPVDQPLREKKQNALKHLNSKTPVHKINGHVGKKKELDRPKKDALKSEAKQPLKQQEISQQRATDGAERLQENQDVEMDSSAASAQVDGSKETESVQVLEKTTKQSGKVVEEKTAEPQEKLRCPVEGCGWFTDLAKNRVALLYHALEDHYGEAEPLELAFRVGNSKCSSCMRVMWSFEHFQHHVERHRLAPRHPCLHQGCTARFKGGMEMRRHARRHSPLQAVCCLPGCSQLFICLWALNLHEREHYAAKPTKPDKDTNEQTGDEQDDTPNGKKQSDHTPKDATVNEDDRKLRGEATHNSTGKHVQAPLPAAVCASPLKEESKERSETDDSHVLKNLSNKDTSAQPAGGPNLRLRQTLRKVTNATKSHKVISSSLKRKNRVRHKFKKKQVKVNTKGPKRRGRPPKTKEAVHDENTTAGQNNQTVVVEKASQLASPPKAAETSNVSPTEEESRQVRDAVEAKSVNKQMKKNHAKQKGVSHDTSTAVVTASSLNQSISTAEKTHKLTAKKPHKVKKRSAPKGSEAASSDSSKTKKHKVTDGQADAEIVEIKSPLGEAEGEGKAESSTQSGDSAPADGLNATTAPPATSGEKTQTTEKKKSHMTKEGKKDATSSGSGRTNKKHKDIDKKGDKGGCKDGSKTSALEKKSKCVEQQVEAKAAIESSPDVEGEAKEEGGSIPAATAGGLNEPKSAQKVTKKEKSPKSNVTKTPKKASQKRKSVPKEGDAKIVKKKRRDEGVPSAKTEPPAEAKAEAAESPGYSVMTNGQAAREDVKPSALSDALAEYRHKPYMRLPPTAYLDEKYITMPKRRKELSFFQSSQRSPPPQHAYAPTALQRQRCANCFATFSGAEELQSHLQLQTCSNLFGFDSDDEGSGFLIK